MVEHSDVHGPSITVVLPAKNEGSAIGSVLERLASFLPDAEILVIDDGSTDDTVSVARSVTGVRVIRHPYSMGNGSAVKRGIREAAGSIIVLMDADGQHDPDELPKLLDAMNSGYFMVVGARAGGMQANIARRLANGLYNRLATWITGTRIDDLTSGFRAVSAKHAREFLHLLPNGFSYPTTITMSFLRSGYPVGFVPVTVHQRTGKSHIRIISDGARFLLIIFRVATLYSPLKLFFPASAGVFLLGAGYFAYTFFALGRFTNMSALLFLSAITIFLVGLVSEQITALMHRQR